ncbi:MAG: hypothetical protein HKN43_00600 [Rhodothermales bacterium]|nr:hypothetical protein [Rhodothermales bacterium]
MRKQRSGFYFVVCLLLVGSLQEAAGQATMSRDDQLEGYRDRVDYVVDHFAYRFDSTDVSRGGYIDIMAKLERGIHMDWIESRLDTLMSSVRGDMFWMYPFVQVQYEGRHSLSPEYRQRMRDLWRTYMPYRGDTENHWAMYYSALYLVTQMYPDEPGSTWYNGKSSQENFDEAEDYLKSWIELTTTIGQGEYDSPGYLNFYVIPMAQLYAYAEDPAMKQRAHMMLDYLLADFAVESLNGVHTGASSRIYPRPLMERWRENSSNLAWLLFGNNPFQARSGAFILALSGYEPPEILHHIATDRSQPYIHKELKRTRHRIRNSDVKNHPVYKYTYMREQYALGSSQGGLLQPIQQHTWELQWAIDDPTEGYNMFFTTHPYSDPKEGTMYFAAIWDMVTELIARSKTEYDSWDKWTGGSDYEQVMQVEDVVVALYNIEKGTRFEHISAFFSRNLKSIEEDPSGWVFAQGGDAYLAYYPIADYEWMDEEDGSKRMFSPHLKNGGVLQVGTEEQDGSFDTFKAAVLGLAISTSTDPVPMVEFETLRGHSIKATYGATPIVDDYEVDYDSWPLYGGPFLNADKGSQELTMTYGKLQRKLDFKTLTITDTVIE